RAIVSTDPGYMIGGMEMVLQFACLARLASYTDDSDDWGWRPSEFVSTIEQSDPSTIKFELKKGIMWYDGDTHEPIGELDAEDVKYSLERMKVAEWKDKAVALDHVEVTGTHTGTLHLSTPFAPIWYTWLADGTGAILSKKAVEAAGGKFDGIFKFYCGPYRVKEWVQKQSFTLEANPNWPGTKPHITDARFVIIDDAKAAEIAYEAGEVDITHISTDTLARYQKDGSPAKSVVEAYPSTNWIWMGLNTEHPKLQDVRLRRAIQHAVDVDTIIEAAYAGISPRSRGVVPPGLIGHRAETKYEKPDLDAARALLEEAGVSDLTIELKTINRTELVAAATVIQANLAEIGITVDVIPMDAGPFWNLGLETEGDDWKDLQMYIHRYLDSPDPSQMVQWFIADQVGVWNWERWKDPEFDELYKQGLVETDETKRHAIYIRMQEIMEDTGAYVWLTHEPIGVIYRDNLKTSIQPTGWLWYIDRFQWT
ncbi:MAG: ABC transporter substrate-binding protein, partial [Gammaproteobacteria bacterium]